MSFLFFISSYFRFCSVSSRLIRVNLEHLDIWVHVEDQCCSGEDDPSGSHGVKFSFASGQRTAVEGFFPLIKAYAFDKRQSITWWEREPTLRVFVCKMVHSCPKVGVTPQLLSESWGYSPWGPQPRCGHTFRWEISTM